MQPTGVEINKLAAKNISPLNDAYQMLAIWFIS